MFSHVQFLTEAHYAHLCLLFPEVYLKLTGAYWNWHDLTYVVDIHTAVEIDRAGVPIDFALKYYKDVALEFGVRLTVHKTSWSRVDPKRFICLERNGTRYELPDVPPMPESEIDAYVGKLATM